MRLRVVDNGTTHEFDPGTVVSVGRDPHSTVVFASEEVSRNHLQIQFEGSAWILTHLSTSNGSFINGETISRCDVPQTPTRVDLSRVTSQFWMEVQAIPEPVSPELPAPPVAEMQGANHGPNIGERTRFGTFTQEFHPVSRRITIGRAEQNDVVLTDDLTVSSSHAEIVSPDGVNWELIDLTSSNGTFVDGQRIIRATIHPNSAITIGRTTFQFAGGALRVFERQGELTFGASGITVLAESGKEKGKVLLDNITFQLPERCVVGILGPSGSGKSTLVRALAGFKFADEGGVSINGENLYGNYDAWRARIGFVPQDDILHTALTVDKALKYAAELRFAESGDSRSVKNRIDEVLAQLRLTEHRGKVITTLSGGQRKRVSVALELLSKPDVIFLDEPTSGLDPGNEKSLMHELRSLADEPSHGRTIIVTTHSVQSLDLCDRLLILSTGGGLAFFGKPNEALQFFGANDYADVFDKLENVDKATAQFNFRQSDQYQKYCAGATPVSHGDAAKRTKPRASQSVVGQFLTLTRRYVSVMTSDKRSIISLLVQAPAIGLVLALLSNDGLHIHTKSANPKAILTLLSLVLAISFLGASNAFREIVKERAIVRRERSFGLSVAAYLASKVVTLGALVVIQSVMLALIGTAFSKGPTQAVLLPNASLELIVSLVMAGVGAMALGLLVSSVAKNGDRAAALLPLLLLAMYLLSGGPTDPHNLPGIGEFSYLNTAKWGFSAVASTAQLPELMLCNDRGNDPVLEDLANRFPRSEEVPSAKELNDRCKVNLWAADRSRLLVDYLALMILSSVFLLGAGVALSRLKD